MATEQIFSDLCTAPSPFVSFKGMFLSQNNKSYKSGEEERKWNSSSSTSINSSQGVLTVTTENNNVAKFAASHSLDNLQIAQQQNTAKELKDLITPNSTPTTSRKNRRRSNLFTSLKNDKHKNGGDFGNGRAIPLKQVGFFGFH
ncbi:hypothetical protein HUJ04_011721 [Dendroctonus ponderosae]|nr:hypothetical protein HUJ04_011721 [Dendroctonus ponderosae]